LGKKRRGKEKEILKNQPVLINYWNTATGMKMGNTWGTKREYTRRVRGWTSSPRKPKGKTRSKITPITDSFSMPRTVDRSLSPGRVKKRGSPRGVVSGNLAGILQD